MSPVTMAGIEPIRISDAGDISNKPTPGEEPDGGEHRRSPHHHQRLDQGQQVDRLVGDEPHADDRHRGGEADAHHRGGNRWLTYPSPLGATWSNDQAIIVLVV